jgi:hypothetical protein
MGKPMPRPLRCPIRRRSGARSAAPASSDPHRKASGPVGRSDRRPGSIARDAWPTRACVEPTRFSVRGTSRLLSSSHVTGPRRERNLEGHRLEGPGAQDGLERRLSAPHHFRRGLFEPAMGSAGAWRHDLLFAGGSARPAGAPEARQHRRSGRWPDRLGRPAGGLLAPRR